MELNNESKTLFIPLYGKAEMSKNKWFINDMKAEEIIQSINFNFKELKQSKWLSMYMAVRAKVIDELCNKHIGENKNTVVIHIGCGLDSRVLRVKENYKKWYDIDFENVIELRKNFFSENDKYKMIGKSITDFTWIDDISEKEDNVLIILEGLTMYLDENELKQIIDEINKRFKNVIFIFDAYSKKAVKASKYKNPVNQMNAKIKWGMDLPEDFNKLNNNLEFVNSYLIKYKEEKLKGLTGLIFNKLYCGKISQSYYKIYEFKLNEKVL